MDASLVDLRRRRVLAAAGALAATCGLPARAQPGANGREPVRLVQLLDRSPDQQEFARDYGTGLRLAFAEGARAGQRVPRLTALETDGTPESVARALRTARDDGAQALLGTVGERLALTSIAAARELGFEIAHLAPWLADTRFDADPSVLPLFASRELQVGHAMRSLAGLGVAELGLVYPDARTELALHPGIERTAEPLKLRTRRFTMPSGQDAAASAAAVPANLPAIVLFLGGTIELALFTQALARRALARYVVCLANVDTTTLMQLAPGRSATLVLTQVVPNPQSSQLEVVRSYRTTLKQLADEAPSPISLAGYLAGRYAVHALARLDGSHGRAEVFAQLRRRPALELGGFRFDFARSARGSDFVDQTLLRSDGRLVG